MNAYRRPSQEHYAYSSDTGSIAACYETSASPELAYHPSSSYNMVQQPFGSYQSSVSSCYGPHASLGVPGTVMQPSLGSLPARHEQPSLRDPRYLDLPRYVAATHMMPFGDPAEYVIESQDSVNEGNMLSEPIIPPLDGFPQVEAFDDLMRSYLNDLSVKKQDKALINAARARNIRNVLDNPKDTAIESAQFRFWVKKMFQLEPDDPRTPPHKKLICHEGKPVAIREKLFKILTRAHEQCQHGGRDKTSAHVRQIYSWVPKELISRFVKICPTCQGRRSSTVSTHLTPPESRKDSPNLTFARPHQNLYGSSNSNNASTTHAAHRRKPAAYPYSDNALPSRHGTTWSDPSASRLHSENSERQSSKLHMLGDAHPRHHSQSHHLVDTTPASQYGSNGFLAANARSRYSGY